MMRDASSGRSVDDVIAQRRTAAPDEHEGAIVRFVEDARHDVWQERHVEASERAEVSHEDALLLRVPEQRAPELGDVRPVRVGRDVGRDGHPGRLLGLRQRPRAEQGEPLRPRGDRDVDTARRACRAPGHDAVHHAGERAACRLAADVPAHLVHVELEAAAAEPEEHQREREVHHPPAERRRHPLHEHARVGRQRAQRAPERRDTPRAEVRGQHVHRHARDQGVSIVDRDRGLGIVGSGGWWTPHVHEVARGGERGDELARVVAHAPVERRILAGDDAPALARRVRRAHDARRPAGRGSIDRERAHELWPARVCALARHSRQCSAMVVSSTGSENRALSVSSDLLSRTMRERRARVWFCKIPGQPVRRTVQRHVQHARLVHARQRRAPREGPRRMIDLGRRGRSGS